MIAFVDLGPVSTEKVSLTGRILLGIGRRVLEGKIYKSEPEPQNGNVNTVYFINQARGNTILESVAQNLITYSGR